MPENYVFKKCVIYIYMCYIYKVYDRNVVNKYGLYLLLGVIIYNLIDYIYIYIGNMQRSKFEEMKA